MMFKSHAGLNVARKTLSRYQIARIKTRFFYLWLNFLGELVHVAQIWIVILRRVIFKAICVTVNHKCVSFLDCLKTQKLWSRWFCLSRFFRFNCDSYRFLSKEERNIGTTHKRLNGKIVFLCLCHYPLHILTSVGGHSGLSRFSFAYLQYFTSFEEVFDETSKDFGQRNGESTKCFCFLGMLACRIKIF